MSGAMAESTSEGAAAGGGGGMGLWAIGAGLAETGLGMWGDKMNRDFQKKMSKEERRQRNRELLMKLIEDHVQTEFGNARERKRMEVMAPISRDALANSRVGVSFGDSPRTYSTGVPGEASLSEGGEAMDQSQLDALAMDSFEDFQMQMDAAQEQFGHITADNLHVDKKSALDEIGDRAPEVFNNYQLGDPRNRGTGEGFYDRNPDLGGPIRGF